MVAARGVGKEGGARNFRSCIVFSLTLPSSVVGLAEKGIVIKPLSRNHG